MALPIGFLKKGSSYVSDKEWRLYTTETSINTPSLGPGRLPNGSKSTIPPNMIQANISSSRLSFRAMREQVSENHKSLNLRFNSYGSLIQSSNAGPRGSSCHSQASGFKVITGQQASKKSPGRLAENTRGKRNFSKLPESILETPEEEYFYKGIVSKQHSKDIDLIRPTPPSVVLTIINLDFASLSLNELLLYMTLDKDHSMVLQRLVLSASGAVLEVIRKCILQNLQILVTHNLGTYAVQKLAARDCLGRSLIEDYCKSNFLRISQNEFGSRLVQALMESSSSFRTSVGYFFRNYPLHEIDSVPLAFLATTLVNTADSWEELQFIERTVRNHFASSMKNKLLKRILLTLMNKLEDEQLALMVECIDLGNRLEDYLNERLMTYIILILILKRSPLVLDIFGHFVRHRFGFLLRTRNIKYLLLKTAKYAKLRYFLDWFTEEIRRNMRRYAYDTLQLDKYREFVNSIRSLLKFEDDPALRFHLQNFFHPSPLQSSGEFVYYQPL